MFGPTSRMFFLVLIALCVVIPLGMAFWNPTWAVVALLVGLTISVRAASLLRAHQIEGALADQDALTTPADRGNVIYVQLVDATGAPLDPAEAQARLAIAHQNAGPRDTVLGVHRQL